MKTFCPNCERETECEFTAELYECKECGEDFAKYIVSRNCNVSDVSITQDVLTDIKTPRSIENNNPDYYKHDELKKENAELKADLKNKNTRIAELEAERRWIPVSERLPEDMTEVLVLHGLCVTTANYYHYRGLLSKHGWYQIDGMKLGVSWATHWMPLPEPPEVTE